MSSKPLAGTKSSGAHSSNTAKNVALTFAVALLAFLAQRSWSVDKGHQTSIVSELGPKLSPNATIILPKDPDFAAATQRWVEYQAPTFGAVVVVRDEQDVQQTVLFANQHNIPFLATAGKHGDFSTMKNLKNGIQIELGQLNKIEISPEGEHATIGGGAKTKYLTHSLAAHGKRAVTGICECVGIGGPMLGGGHGFLQGQYGLMADQLISARLVLANGTAISVSAQSNSDLYWALKGAGHNFGIVTEVEYKIYDARGHEDWSTETFIFSGDQLEAFLTTINTLAQTQPAAAPHWGLIVREPALDADNAVIIWTVLYDGPESALKAHTASLHELQPLVVKTARTLYLDLPALFGSNNEAPPCQPGSTFIRFPIRVKNYDIPDMRQVYNIFNRKMQERPVFNNSMLALESYSVQGVRAVPAESTAYPFRDDDVFISPFAVYAPDPSLDAEAMQWGEQMRKPLLQGTGNTELHSYVNYAYGRESLEALYGHEAWRLEKLRRLKAEYDPKGRFNFYAPIS